MSTLARHVAVPNTDQLCLHVPGMPPKKAKAKALAAPPVVRLAVDGSVGIEIELRPGERDNSDWRT